jgi:hypothetical protein
MPASRSVALNEREEKMRRSMCFLVAAFLAGGAGASVAWAQQQGPAAAVPTGQYGYSYVQPDQPSNGPLGLGLGRRLSNLFHRQRPADYTPTTAPQSIYQSPEPPLAQPAGAPAPALVPVPARRPMTSYQAVPSAVAVTAPAAAPLVAVGGAPGLMPISHEQEPPAQAAQGEIKKENVLRVAIADDASWVIGELQYVHADGGIWVVRYAPLDKEDRYGGAVVLAKGQDMSKFREGDLVFVKGSMLNEGRASKFVGGPLYRATSIELNERPGEQ